MSTLLNPCASGRPIPLQHLVVTPRALASLKRVLCTSGFEVSPGVVVGQRLDDSFIVMDTVGGQVMADRRGWPLPVVLDVALAGASRLGNASARAMDGSCSHWGWWMHLDGVGWSDLRPPPPVRNQVLNGAAWSIGRELAILLSTVRESRLLVRGFRVMGTDVCDEIDVICPGGDLRL